MREQEASQLNLQHSGCTVSWRSEANPTAMKLSQRLTQQDGMIDSCPLYLPPLCGW